MELNCLEDYWPSAGELSAVNVIGTKLRGLINSGVTRWRVAVYKLTSLRKLGGIPRVSTRFSLSVANEQTDAGRDELSCLARPNSQARTGTGRYSFSLFS